MKQKAFFICAAAVAMFAFAACEPEEEPHGSPSIIEDTVPTTDTIPTTANPLVGTSWFNHYEASRYGIRLVLEDLITFSTDSEGTWKTGGETTYEPWWDTTFAITYTYNPENNHVSVTTHYFTDDPIQFIYYPDEQLLITDDQDHTEYTPVEDAI